MSVTGFNRRRRELAERGREAEQRNAEGQKAKEEPTFNELREEAKEKQIKGYGRMNKVELKEALGKS